MPPRAFTLIELLIAMTLTLMLVYAIAQFYAYVGETVRDGRAQIEMGGQLRAAAQRLQQDLAEMTVRIGARSDPGSQQGVFAIIEGAASDIDPNGDLAVTGLNNLFSADVPSIIPANSAVTDPNNDLKPDGAMLGDCDDILVMTIRSQGEPFVGRQFTGMVGGIAQYAVIQSNLAEVIWFTTFKDVNSDGVWNWDTNLNGVVDTADVPEPRYLVRRQLLILPGATVSWPTAPAALPPGQSIYHHNDISCHVVLNSMGNFAGYVANSLGDLSQRENRCIHQNLSNLDSNGLLAPNYMPNSLQLRVGLTNVPSIPLYPAGSCALYSLDGIDQFHGEDKMLANVLAFDVRVYDPFAVLRADNSDMTQATATTDDDAQGVLSPGDPGYAYAALPINNFPAVGNGAYVDLWYARIFQNIPVAQRIPIMQNCNSSYAWAPALGAGLNAPANGAAWDNWSLAYEKDGPAQFGGATADEMVDGLDNNGIGGVDDPSEAETRPPYPATIGDNGIDEDGDGLFDGADHPNVMSPPNTFFETFAPPATTILRGIEVRIRMYEPGTRQTRQQTVATDFIPE
ncbi:MAG: prepilin-type N-terminal cleavage/methylation domain-containing protein [Pirellulaceae bacterium]|nr:prepilin-type N-terminal cleavage/methylation domain-containing protein [Pirellulaceae bacterium]